MTTDRNWGFIIGIALSTIASVSIIGAAVIGIGLVV